MNTNTSHFSLFIRIIGLISIALHTTSTLAQVSIFQWDDHLSYTNGVATEYYQGKIIVATTGGLYSLSSAKDTPQKINTLSGLSSSQVTAIAVDSADRFLVIGYEDGNLDVFYQNQILNIPDIFLTPNVQGSKQINDILIQSSIAYLSTDFGIVEVDLLRREIKDSYFLGENGSQIAVFQTVIFQDTIFASVGSDILKAHRSDPLLTFFETWVPLSIDTLIWSEEERCTHMSWYEQGIVFNLKTADDFVGNTQYRYSSGTLDSLPVQSIFPVHRLKNDGNSGYYMVGQFYAFHVLADDTRIVAFNEDSYSFTDLTQTEDGRYFASDALRGLRKDNNPNTFIAPEGPPNSFMYRIHWENEGLYVAPGGRSEEFTRLYSRLPGAYRKQGEWRQLVAPDTLGDLMRCIPDPVDPSITWACSYGRGILQFQNDTIFRVFNDSNSTIDALFIPEFYAVSGIAFDNENNLWGVVQGTENTFVKKTPEGEWSAYPALDLLGESTFTLDLSIIGSTQQKWLIAHKNGIVVLDETQDGLNRKVINSGSTTGNLPSDEVLSVAEDATGRVWIGTGDGLAVLSNPRSIFSSNAYAAQEILVEFEENVEVLFAGERIQSIAVDGGDRKWFGTRSGAFLLSPDGKEQIEHFTVDNSPLFSNNILDIAIDHVEGDVYFVTDKGTLSYRGSATQSVRGVAQARVFPNPFIPSEGHSEITIDGLVDNGSVKIADISGRVVYESDALGGRCVWDTKTLDGKPVAGGTYLVYSTDEAYEDTFLAKFTIVR